MKAIGRSLACVLLAVALVKNVLATSATANVEFPTGQYDKVPGSNNVTWLELGQPPSPDNEDLRSTSSKDPLEPDDGQATELQEPRTFGQKRIQFMLMPMMYKMGVMMTMLMILTAISLKGLVIGVMLLVLKLSTFLAKFQSGWHAPHSWSSPQPIHVHVHNSPHAYPHSWEPSGPADDHYYYKG